MLHKIAQNGNVQHFKDYLGDKKFDVNVRNNDGCTALHLCSNKELIEELFKITDIDINIKVVKLSFIKYFLMCFLIE